MIRRRFAHNPCIYWRRRTAGQALGSPGGETVKRPHQGHLVAIPEVRGEAVNIGVAAHITAASTGGPRFNPNLTSEQRSAINNGIWLCQSCAKLIDNDEQRFATNVLATWKTSAELQAKLRLQTPLRPQDADEPILLLPSTESSVSWLPFSARATALVGRDAEREQLERFVQSNHKVSWMLLVGAAGTGKSRLALELCHALCPEWNAGFFSRTDRFRQWAHLRPQRPTLIIIDYVASRAAEASALVLDLARSAAYLPAPVRILLMERERGRWWARFLREDSHSESTELLACQHDEPLRLGSLSPEALQSLAADVARLRQIPWTDATAHAFANRMRTLDRVLSASLRDEGRAWQLGSKSRLEATGNEPKRDCNNC